MALAAVKGDRTIAQLSEPYGVHASQITTWKDQLLAGAANVFGPGGGSATVAPAIDIKALHSEIFNTDQGSQFTGAAFTGVLAAHDIKISMDGKGAWRDNVFVERLWRTVKYEEVYLRAYDSVSDARASLGRYLDLYNPASERPSVYVVEVKRFC